MAVIRGFQFLNKSSKVIISGVLEHVPVCNFTLATLETALYL